MHANYKVLLIKKNSGEESSRSFLITLISVGAFSPTSADIGACRGGDGLLTLIGKILQLT